MGTLRGSHNHTDWAAMPLYGSFGEWKHESDSSHSYVDGYGVTWRHSPTDPTRYAMRRSVLVRSVMMGKPQTWPRTYA
eukprot:1559219-Rhodomonas_salina.3